VLGYEGRRERFFKEREKTVPDGRVRGGGTRGKMCKT
jgi:hypothetical protein